jgi:hypothetical protein
VNEKARRPIVSNGSPLAWVLAALMFIALGIYGMPAALEELKAGQAYSLAVVFGDGSKVQKDISPISFWLNLGLHFLPSF